MWLLIAALLAINPQFQDKQVVPAFHREDRRIQYFQTLFRRPVSATEDILVVLGGSPDATWKRDPKYRFWLPGDRLGIFKVQKGGRARAQQVAMLKGENKDCAVKIERADSRSLTISCTGDYGMRHEFLKVFYDLGVARSLKLQKFSPASVSRIGATEATAAAGSDRLRVSLAGATPVLSRGVVSEEERLPQVPVCDSKPLPQEAPPLPQSTQEELAAARPGEKDQEILEEIGGCHLVGRTLWFGTHFCDGEGMTGVGRIGKFDLKTRKYTFFRPAGLRDFATSALLVEPNAIWAGLVHHPEGAASARGLLRWNPETGEEMRYLVTEVILEIKRIGDVVWVGTVNGLFRLAGDRLTHYTIEPALTGGYEVKAN